MTAARPVRSGPAVVVLLSALAVALVLAGAPSGVRFGVLLAFLGLVPGAAVLGLLRPWVGAAPIGLVLATSFALSLLAAQTMLWLGAWEPDDGLVAIATVCVVLAVVDVVRARRRRDGAPPAGPMWATELELAGRPVPTLRPPVRDGGEPYCAARVLIRVHGQPLGFLTLAAVDGVVASALIVERVQAQLGDVLAAHLEADGLVPGPLDARGLPGVDAPACTVPHLHQPLVSVVVCTRDRPDSLRTALRSLLDMGYPELEVIVVDNAPRTDAARAVVDELADGRVRYVSEARPGLSRARNTGIAAASGELLAFTDDDVVADPLWIDNVVRGFARAGHVGLVTGLVPAAELETRAQRYFDSKVQWGASCRARLYDLGANRTDHPLYPYSAGIFGTGANFAASRAALADIGPFDEALGAGTPSQGGEDLDYFLRAILAGWAIAYEPGALVWHMHRRDDDALVRQMYGYGTGFGAYVYKYLRRSDVALDFARRVPRGVVRFARTKQRAAPAAPAPRAAQRTELRGLLAGPRSYTRGRALVRAAQEKPVP